MIYLDNAATSLHRPKAVIDAVAEAMESLGNSARGSGGPGMETARMLYRARAKLASFFGAARPEQVVFAANATEALNTVIAGLIPDGVHVITTVTEHNSVLRPLYRLEEERGISLTFIGLDEQGAPDVEAIDAACRKETKAIVVNHASNVTGTVADIEQIGRIAKKHGIIFIVDAAQSAGSIAIDCQRLGIDALCFTGHKGLMGPQGTGGICLGEKIEVRPLKVGGTGAQSKSRRQPAELPDALEAGTPNAHGIAGLYAAVSWIEETGIDSIREKEKNLTERFLRGARDIPEITVYGKNKNQESTAVVALNVSDFDSAVTADRLAEHYAISTRAGLHCAPLMHEALGTSDRGVVRFSFNWFTTEDEIDQALGALRAIARTGGRR